MTAPITLTLSGDQYARLRQILFPGDGKEAVAILLCGRRGGLRRHRLLVRTIVEIPQLECAERLPGRVRWSTDSLAPALDQAEEHGLSVVKIHSHPGGHGEFSPIDDQADRQLLPMIHDWVEHKVPHGSAIMLPDGAILARILWPGQPHFQPFSQVNVAGDDLKFWYPAHDRLETPGFLASQSQIFDDGTIERLRRLSIAVVGASGTGSPVVEQLYRLGVGELVLVDDEPAEERNINRVLNSTIRDARRQRPKVLLQKEAIERAGLGTRVVALEENLWTREAVHEVAQCDVVFGCMDSVDGRYLLNTISTYYSIPYFDIGVRLLPDQRWGRQGIREVCGTVNYLQPGKSSLMSRGLFSMSQVAQAGLARNDPAAYRQQVDEGYIAGGENHRPAVISVNMFAASLAVNEFLARLHPYREEENAEHAAVQFSLASMELISEAETGTCEILADKTGLGDVEPLLGQLELMKVK